MYNSLFITKILYILSYQYEKKEPPGQVIAKNKLSKAVKNIFAITFEQFRDTVISYLAPEDQTNYNQSSSWDEIKLKTVNFIEELGE